MTVGEASGARRNTFFTIRNPPFPGRHAKQKRRIWIRLGASRQVGEWLARFALSRTPSVRMASSTASDIISRRSSIDGKHQPFLARQQVEERNFLVVA